MESQEVSFTKGVTYRKMGLYTEALVEFEGLLSEDSWRYRAAHEIAACHVAMGDADKAEKALLQALCAIDVPKKDRLSILAALAELYESLDKVESALERLLLIRDMEPEFLPDLKERIARLFERVAASDGQSKASPAQWGTDEDQEPGAENGDGELEAFMEGEGPESLRRAPRVKMSGPVNYSFDQIGWSEGHGADISTGGMFVLTHEPVPIGSVIFLNFQVPEHSPGLTFEIIGQTVRQERNRLIKNGILGMGVQFVSMEETQKEALFDIIGKMYVQESEAQRLASELRFHCDHCGQILSRPESMAGQEDQCSCGTPITVPYSQHHPLPGNPMAGFEIAGCRIDRVVGEGSAATVYKGHHLALDIPVAIKILKTDQRRIKSHMAKNFLREARVIAKLKHSNIVDVMNAGEEKGQLFIVMQYVTGRSLGKAVAGKEKISINDFIRIFLDVCSALAEAHKHAIIHRDVKPDNILLTPGGRAMLVDFGLVKDMESYQDAGETGLTLGTPLFISPEQARSEPDIDCRADIYSLGATMYYTLAGRPPFQAYTVLEVIRKHFKEPLTPVVEVAPHVPKAISDIVSRTMKKKRENRFQSVDEVRESLTRVSGDLAIEQFKPLAKRLLKKRPSLS